MASTTIHASFAEFGALRGRSTGPGRGLRSAGLRRAARSRALAGHGGVGCRAGRRHTERRRSLSRRAALRARREHGRCRGDGGACRAAGTAGGGLDPGRARGLERPGPAGLLPDRDAGAGHAGAAAAGECAAISTCAASDNVEMLRALGRDPLYLRDTRIAGIAGLVDLMGDAQAGAVRASAPDVGAAGRPRPDRQAAGRHAGSSRRCDPTPARPSPTLTAGICCCAITSASACSPTSWPG